MKDVISFSVPGSNAIHELQLGYTLLLFNDFDLNFFRDECARIYRRYLKAGEDVVDKALAHKEYIRKCHPYCKALLNTTLSEIALDCIIDEIRKTEGIGIEELWVKNLSATDSFGQALFSRITDYKTGTAINQWTNLLRMKAYVAAKIDMIYGAAEADSSVHKARKLYYDFAFKLTATNLGFQNTDLPRVRMYSVPLLPDAVTMMKNAHNILGPLVDMRMENIMPREPLKGKECVQDQMAGMALNLMMDIERPDVEEIHRLNQTYGALPITVYEPSGFKAIIDLEFDLLMEAGYYLQAGEKGYTRAKYASSKKNQDNTVAFYNPSDDDEETPVVAVGMTADDEEIHMTTDSENGRFTVDEAEGDADIPIQEEAQNNADEETDAAPMSTIAADAGKLHVEGTESETPALIQEEVADTADEITNEPPVPATITDVIADIASDDVGKVRQIINLAEDPNRQESKKRTLQEVNMRCNLIWTSMNVRSGWSISSEEATEWFRYLTRLRYGIGTGELTPEALDKFLDATLEVYELLPDNV